MEISVNQQIKEIPDAYSVEQLVRMILPDLQKGIAVAVNQDIIPRADWGARQLQQQDQVIFIRATQGG